MVQIVKWRETNINYKEGPFVIAFNLFDKYWGVLCETPLLNEPLYPELSIQKLCSSQKKNYCYNPSKEEVTAICNWLNGLVTDGKIIKNTYKRWVLKKDGATY